MVSHTVHSPGNRIALRFSVVASVSPEVYREVQGTVRLSSSSPESG